MRTHKLDSVQTQLKTKYYSYAVIYVPINLSLKQEKGDVMYWHLIAKDCNTWHFHTYNKACYTHDLKVSLVSDRICYRAYAVYTDV